MIMECDAVENCMFLEILNWCKWLDCSNQVFTYSLTGTKLNKLIPDNVMGLKIIKS